MTKQVYNRILVNTDGMVVYQYKDEYGQKHRKILFREADDGSLWIMDPATKKEHYIGKLIRAPGAMIVVFIGPSVAS